MERKGMRGEERNGKVEGRGEEWRGGHGGLWRVGTLWEGGGHYGRVSCFVIRGEEVE